jgi:hypothetical protein
MRRVNWGLVYAGGVSVDFTVNTYMDGYVKLIQYRNSQEYTYGEEKDKITSELDRIMIVNFSDSALFPLIWFKKIVINSILILNPNKNNKNNKKD